ncbi:MAG: hypothetical protein KDK41_15740 [Leptospiraceae bacterium]|nr:hypothetical protein [Leptospiraceae bacterium]
MKIKYLLIVFILTHFFGEKLVATKRKDFMIFQYNNHSLLKYLHGKGIPENSEH